MFVKINDSCIANTDHIVWIDKGDEVSTVTLSDGTKHSCSDFDKLNSAISIINVGAKNNSIIR